MAYVEQRRTSLVLLGVLMITDSVSNGEEALHARVAIPENFDVPCPSVQAEGTALTFVLVRWSFIHAPSPSYLVLGKHKKPTCREKDLLLR